MLVSMSDGLAGQAAEEIEGDGPPRAHLQPDDADDRHPRRLDAYEG